MWHSWKGDQYLAIHDAHHRLGPVVRIAPNHVSFTDPAAYKDIYGHGVSIVKDDFYAHVADGNPSMAQAVNKSVHAAKRRSLAHVFSAKEIVAMEPRVIQTTEQLCSALRSKVRGELVGPDDQYETREAVLDVRPWLNMFSYDAITAMFFTNSYGFLTKGNDLCPSADAHDKVKQVHAMDSFHSAGRFNATFAQLPKDAYKACRKLLWFVHGNKSGLDFAGMARACVRARMLAIPGEPDLFSRLPSLATEKRPIPMPEEELVAECATMLDAGNDTTQTTLTNCVFHLATHPQIQEKLYNRLAAIVNEEHHDSKVMPTTLLQQVPYLRAVLEENWRCRPPVARGLPRRTTQEGATIAGHYIPAGVTVSAPIYTLHHNESLFPNATEFIPERWLPEESSDEDGAYVRNLKEYCMPFSLGPRACIGRNLAYMEVSIVMAALVLNFEWEMAEPGSDMPMVERFNCNPKELLVRARARE